MSDGVRYQLFRPNARGPVKKIRSLSQLKDDLGRASRLPCDKRKRSIVMTTLHVPVIDLQPYFLGTPGGKDAVAKAVGIACRDIGFLVITNHQ